MKKYLIWVLLTLAAITLSACSNTGEQTVKNFTPIIDNNGADPNIYQDKGIYYYTKTTGNNVTIWRSKNLTTVAAGESKIIWNIGSDFDSAWAPEIHRINGTWYIYVALEKTGADIHQMYVLVNQSANPFEGTWSLTPLAGMDDKFAIDGTVFSANGKEYFIWSGWAGYDNVAQNLYISQMISPTEVTKGQKIEISHPQYYWELMETPVINEGPEVIIHKDTINLTYSASGSWTNDYCLGLITAKTSANLLDPKSWVKDKNPLFSSTADTFGPGHNGFATSEDGKENWLIFHAARVDGSGWARSVRLQSFTWTKDNTIQISQPESADKAINLPSGEAEHIRLYTDSAQLSKGLSVKSANDALGGKTVVGFEDPNEQLSLNTEVKAGSYAVIVYVKTNNFSDPTDDTQSLSVTLNGKEYDLNLAPSQYYQPVQFTADLKDSNNIVIHSEIGGSTLSIDRVELVKD